MSDSDEHTQEVEAGESAEELAPHMAPMVLEVYRRDPITGVDLLFDVAKASLRQSRRLPPRQGATPTPVPLSRTPSPTGSTPVRKDEPCATVDGAATSTSEGDASAGPDPYEEAGAERARRRLSQRTVDK